MEMHFLAAPRQFCEWCEKSRSTGGGAALQPPCCGGSSPRQGVAAPGMRNREPCSANPSGETPALGERAGPGLQEAVQHLLWTINLDCRKWQGFVSVQVAEKEGIQGLALSERHMIKSWACSRLDNLLSKNRASWIHKQNTACKQCW